MIAALLAGAVAGYGIAIPVGAIAILIVETGLQRGFRLAAAAGSGAAVADGIYATIAGTFGAALAIFLAPFDTLLRIVAVVVLVAIAIRGLLRLRRPLTLAAAISDLLSQPVRLGYMAGLAVIIIVSQLPKLFGFSTDGGNIVVDVSGW